MADADDNATTSSHRAHVASVAAVLFVLAAAGCRDAKPSNVQNVGNAPVEFGQVAIGASTRRVVAVRAPLNTEAWLTGFHIENENPSFMQVDADSARPVRVPAGGSIGVVVVFSPLAPGPVSAQLAYDQITTDARTQRTAALHGTGAAAAIELSVDAISFGVVAPNLAVERTLTIRNAGLLPLHFGSMNGGVWETIAPRPSADSWPGFSVTLDGYDSSTGIPPDRSVTVHVRLQPGVGPTEIAGTLEILSDDPKRPLATVVLSAQVPSRGRCVFEPDSYDFGKVSEETQRTVSLANVGNALSNVTSLALTAGSEPHFRLDSGPASVRAQTSEPVALRFIPPAGTLGTFHGALTAVIDGSTLTLPLTAEAVAPFCIELLSGPITLNAVSGCGPERTSVFIRNKCSTATTLDTVTIPDSTAFRVLGGPPKPITLEPGADYTVTVLFERSEPGTDQAVLVATSGGSEVYVRLTGIAAGRPTHSSGFYEPQQVKFDVLVVLDDTPAMAPYQRRVVTELGKLLACERGVDYHVGVTTTSVDVAHGGTALFGDAANGRLRAAPGGGPRFVTPETPGRQKVLEQLLTTGNMSSAPPMLLWPIVLAVSSPLRDAENAGFLRSDARLLTVIVTAGEDHDPTASDGYRAFLAYTSPVQSYAWTRAVLPMTPLSSGGCADPNTTTAVLKRLSSVASTTADLCSDGWSLAPVCPVNPYPVERFALQTAPDPNSISIWVNGVAWPATAEDGTRRWEYDAATKEIVFAADAPPPPNSRVEIDFSEACAP